MAFAAAVSVHPVSSHATGEVVGALFEAVGPGADLVIVAATPGHGGALEDIAATARRLLSPTVLLAAVTTGLGAGGDYVRRGPGLAAWSGTCGPVAPIGPGGARRLGPGGAWRLGPGGAWRLGPGGAHGDIGPGGAHGDIGPGGAHGDIGPGGAHGDIGSGGVRPPFEVTGVLALGRGSEGWLGADWPALPAVAGAVAGPVVLDGALPGPGPAGVAFGPGSGFTAVTAHGLRDLGPPLAVTRADGTMLYELDGQPALRRLIDVARDGMPAGELTTLGPRLHLQVTDPGSGQRGDCPPPVPAATAVLGADRANGALALGHPIEAGATVRFAMADPAAVPPALSRSVDPSAAGALVLAPAGMGHLLGAGPGGFVDGGAALPSATLICETAPPPGATPGRSDGAVATIQAAYFPRRASSA